MQLERTPNCYNYLGIVGNGRAVVMRPTLILKFRQAQSANITANLWLTSTFYAAHPLLRRLGMNE